MILRIIYRILRPDLLCMGIYTHAVCCIKTKLQPRGSLLVHLCLYFVCIRSVYKRCPKLVFKLTKSTILLV
uniref:Uncharacterized protein n=1 Tax=Helianthus annuus TaxID=4232 RepID=A0A251SZW9_HELAN